MTRLRICLFALVLCESPGYVFAQPEPVSATFRRANEHAARSRWDEALLDYGRLDQQGARSPSLYWNWAQAASARGRKGEACWALLRARELAPTDPGPRRELNRVRGELGLDPSEVSLGLLGELRLVARRFRFDLIALALILLSIVALVGKQPRRLFSLVASLCGLLLLSPLLMGARPSPRGVVIQKDAPLLDLPRNDALAISTLREGEVVPLLAEEGEFVRIQDASGARGFAHKADVRKLGFD